MSSYEETGKQIRELLDSLRAPEDQRDRLAAEELLALRHSSLGIMYLVTAAVLVGLAALIYPSSLIASAASAALSAVVLCIGGVLCIRGTSRLHKLAGRLRRLSGHVPE